ncbi:hypothetical protein [Algoriphagus formosus]|uniref:Outer membrane protein beta-barrel domain-containing protein n=1 Tax=Algoriphagus formosus TaxID=2007308 RepID=A0A4R5V8J6_9BACT|nr:hypothetical protein [Algoriphagus aquimaris]TDK47925.1 hypothetical protein E1898_04430 [Algoriphagus aquimaris]
MKSIILTAILIAISVTDLMAQQGEVLTGPPPKMSPPIPVEAFAGDKGLVFQMIVNKRFSPESRFGFFNVTNFVGDYSVEDQRNQFLSQSFVTADIWKGLSANVGASLNYMTGFRPSAGLQYVFANREILAVILPRFDLTQTYNFETFGLFEYKPKFDQDWGLYTRAQALYNHNSKLDFHDRSYVWLRVGAAYKNFQFGLGANFDVYGPAKINENSYGVFIRTELF